MIRNLLLSILLILSYTSYSNTDTTYQIESIQVVGIRPLKKDAISMTTINADTSVIIPSADPFFLINRYTPNVLSQSDNGNLYGYSYIKIRGLDQTRINFTLNGIPLNEMEDQGIYFSNMPGFMNNIEKIQIQRGIGISKYGTTSFAGSVDLEPKSLLKNELTLGLSGGSYGTLAGNMGYSSGLIKNKFTFSSNLSYLNSSGFREHSGTDGFTYFGQFGYFGKKNIIKVYEFSGLSRNDMAWLAPSDSLLNLNIKINLNSELEKDQFNQNFIAINWINYSLKNIKFNSSIYFNNVNGKYTSYLDPVVLGKFGLNSYQTGIMSNIVYEKGTLIINGGINYNYYQRKHTLVDDLYPKDLFYKNRGYKQDLITFIKINKTFKGIDAFLDVQYRYVNFNYNKEVSHGWNFINPKIGLKYSKEKWNVYTSFAITSREVTRTDLLNGYDDVDIYNNNASAFGDTFQINYKPERCYNFEIGGLLKIKGFKLESNFYTMYFNNERISTGDINYIGLLLKKSTKKSLRTGIEIDLSYEDKGFYIGSNLALSKNKIYHWVDNNGNNFYNKIPFSTPKFVMNNFIQYTNKFFFVNINGTYMSKMYMDNTQNESLTSPQYYILNSIIGFKYKSLTVSASVNNITGKRYYLPGGTFGDRPAFYPGALRNYMANIQIKI